MKHYEERIPLRTILQHFVNHVESLEIASQTHITDCYEQEFLDLKLFSESLKTNAEFSSSEGEKEVNRKKNRYKDILPFDLSRVILDEYPGIPGSDYINANYIKGASGSMAYIASQGPLPHTVNDFWRMIVQCEVKVIVMACNEKESGKHKCENYWVEKEGLDRQFGMANVRLIKASPICPDFCVRMLKLTYTNAQNKVEERTVCQFHYSAWPDHGVPPLVRPLLDMVRLVRDTQASETLPVLVHCSAGCGRTGTICAIDYVGGLLRMGKLTKDFSLFGLVREMRKQRIAMVQTKEQYILVHQAVKELFLEQLRMIDSHPYENIDCDGCLISCELPVDPLYDTIKNCRRQDSSSTDKDIAEAIQKRNRKQITSASSTPQKPTFAQPTPQSTQPTPQSTPVQTPTKPRIGKFKSLFEKNLTPSHLKSRNKPSVCRSNSLGAVYVQKTNAKTNTPIVNRTGEKEKPKIVTIVKPIQKPSHSECNVKRSKSLRLLSSSGKLTFNERVAFGKEPEPLSVRTLSLESIVDDGVSEMMKQAKSSSHIEKIQSPYDFEILHRFKYLVSGLGIRERRNSFRKAVEKSSQQQNQQKYTSKPFLSSQITSPVAVVKPQRHVRLNSNEDHNDNSGSNLPATSVQCTLKPAKYEINSSQRYSPNVSDQYKPSLPAPNREIIGMTPSREVSGLQNRDLHSVMTPKNRDNTGMVSQSREISQHRDMNSSNTPSQNRDLSQNIQHRENTSMSSTQNRELANVQYQENTLLSSTQNRELVNIQERNNSPMSSTQNRELVNVQDRNNSPMSSTQNRELANVQDRNNSSMSSTQNRELVNVQDRNNSPMSSTQNRELANVQHRDSSSMSSTQNRDMTIVQNRDTSVAPSRDSNDGMLTPKRPVRELNFPSPKTVSSVKMRNRSRDDLALCSTSQTSKVKRHASVMLYRNSLIEDSTTHKPMTIWQGTPDISWSQTPGVDIDQVAASISLQSDSTKKHLNNVLQNIHTRKSKSIDPATVNCGNRTININNLSIANINLGSKSSSSSSSSNSNLGNNSLDNNISLNSSNLNSPLGNVMNSRRKSPQTVNVNKFNSNNASSMTSSIKQNDNPSTVKQHYL